MLLRLGVLSPRDGDTHCGQLVRRLGLVAFSSSPSSRLANCRGGHTLVGGSALRLVAWELRGRGHDGGAAFR